MFHAVSTITNLAQVTRTPSRTSFSGHGLGGPSFAQPL
jgi:hypothetical protein